MHNLSLSFVQNLDKYVISRLKRWAGLYRSADVGALFRHREDLGLQMTSLELHYQRMQVTKCCLLENSQDDKVRAIYENFKIQKQVHEKGWSGPKELARLAPIAEHNLRFAAQTGTAGLGSCKSDPYIASPTKKEMRNKITESLIAQHEEDHIRHPSYLVQQGVWTTWDKVILFDLSWANIYGPGPHVIAFVLNAQINSLRRLTCCIFGMAFHLLLVLCAMLSCAQPKLFGT